MYSLLLALRCNSNHDCDHDHPLEQCLNIEKSLDAMAAAAQNLSQKSS